MGGPWNLGVGVGGPGQLPGPLRRECSTLELGGGGGEWKDFMELGRCLRGACRATLVP